MTAKVILNPYAGRWTARERKKDVEAALRAAGVDYELVETEGPEHGTQLAAEAARAGYSPVIAAGGDGTVSEIANGLLSLSSDLPPMGIMPLGTADDLVYNLRLARDLPSAAQNIARGRINPIDVMQVSWESAQASGTRYSINNSAVGLEPYVTMKQMKMKRLRGNLRYMTATVLSVLDKPEYKMDLEWEGGEYHGPISLVTVGNGARTGGVFFMTPHADLRDGQITFVYGYLPTRRAILKVLPSTTKEGTGNYTENPAIHEVSTSWLRIKAQTPAPLHADGEIQSSVATCAEYHLLPRALPVLA